MRIKTTASVAALAIIAVATLAACTSAPQTAAVKPDAVIGTWVMEKDFPKAPETPYLALSADSSWVGSDGCNTVQGTWEIASDGKLIITAGPSTLIACDGAPLPSTFAEATGLSLDGGKLTIAGPSGKTTLVLTKDPNVGPQDPVGAWGEDAQGKPSLELSADGKLAGTDGCNRLVGSWQGDGSRLDFGPIASTMMFCEGIDTWLSGAHWATLRAGVMTVYNEAGVTIGQLQRR